ncbi:tonin-like [Cimex lectularius]|uniref:Peptidase S1 domain-containing protein n=1 Tax=Cimex lectularius TaxID=79782 RepID=A0A8I6TF56_CIMLE|nr:tonin-like [Cimex lectularius]
MFTNFFPRQLSCSSRKLAVFFRLCSWILFLLLVCSVIGEKKQESKIIGGRRAQEGEFPYVVCIRGQFLCGGVLLDLKSVLTATRCFYRANAVVTLSKVQVVAGTINLRDSIAQTIGVSSFFPHVNFTAEKTNTSYHTVHDIGIARLLYSFEENPNLKPYSIFPFHSAEEMEASFRETQKAGSRCWTMGFGLKGTRKLAYFLQVIEITMLPDEECEGFSTNSSDSVICAKSAEPGKARPAGGDFGNPLVCGRRYFGVTREVVLVTDTTTIVFTPIWPYLSFFNLNLISSGTVPSLTVFWCLTGFLILDIISQL